MSFTLSCSTTVRVNATMAKSSLKVRLINVACGVARAL